MKKKVVERNESKELTKILTLLCTCSYRDKISEDLNLLWELLRCANQSPLYLLLDQWWLQLP